MAHIGNFSDSEKAAIEELRNRMKGDMEPELYEDLNLFYRFLKAHDFSVNNAESMLKKHLEWREKKNTKNIMNYKLPEVAEKYFSYVFLGYDKEGCVVRYSPVGSTDITGFTKSLKFEEIEKMLVYHSEMDGFYLKQNSEKLGRNIDQCVYIYDMENFSFKTGTDKKVLRVLINFCCLHENNYPERMKATYIINYSFKGDLLEIIDGDVLPAFLGGNRTDPDGNLSCPTLINYSGPVPEELYMHKGKRSLASMLGVKKIALSQADFHEEFVEVTEPGSYLEWEFETKCRDIGFGVFYEDVSDGDSKMVELIPHQRIDTEDYAETGTYLCEKIGKYVVLFDNSYSWIRSKEIFYRIRLITPKELDSQLKEEMKL